jgi:hypothetical protein
VCFSVKALILRAQSARKMSALSPFLRVARATRKNGMLPNGLNNADFGIASCKNESID